MMMMNVRLLIVNDVYAVDTVNSGGGWPCISTLVKEHSKGHDNCLFLVGGDVLGGSSLAQKTKGSVVVELMNQMNVDVAVLGNHEFDFGPEVLKQRMKESTFDWLGANVYDNTSKRLIDGAKSTFIRDFPAPDGSNIRVGFFGICTEHSHQLSNPGPTIEFAKSFDSAKECVSLLQSEDCDVIVAMTHVSVKEDRNIANNVPGIDVIVGGHDHTPYAEMEKNCLLMKCGQNGYWLGVVDLHIETHTAKDGRRIVKNYKSWQMILNRNVTPDPSVKGIIDRTKSELETEADRLVLCRLDTQLDTRTSVLRTMECNSGNLVADALKDRTGAQLGFINGGFIRGDCLYEEGHNLTAADLHDELPFQRHVSVVTIRGKHVRGAVAQMLAKVPAPIGCFPQPSKEWRVEYEEGKMVEAENDAQRVEAVKVYVGDSEIDPEAFYTIAMTGFTAAGGDGITEWAQAESCEPFRDDLVVRDLVAEYLLEKGAIAPVVEGRVTKL